jgi:probable rRNA maturation factor
MIDICFEDIEQNELVNDSFLQSWFLTVIQRFDKEQGDITIVFCSDAYILEMNRSHLNHDYYTDIITFDYCEGDLVSGDLFISLDTVLSNSIELGTSFTDEIHRVCVHGLLHLLGFKDKTDDDEREMRRQEDIMLSIR